MDKIELPALQFKKNRLWAVQLTNTEHKKWGDAENFRRLTYDWSGIELDGRQSMNEILIAVAQHYPTHNPTSIKNIASGIYNYSRLQEGDGILGVIGQSEVQKVGFVGSNNIGHFSHSITFDIDWIQNIQSGNSDKQIFSPSMDIQKVTSKMLQSLNLPVVSIEESLYEKSSYKTNVFEETSFLKLHLQEEAEITEKEDKGGEISIFFGTNRNRTESLDFNDYFGNERSDLKYGKVEVSIPRGHIQGELERPGSFLRWEFPEKESKHVVLKKIEELNETRFITWLSKDINLQSDKTGLIFIHGFNVTFAEAARRTAQIAWDVPFNGLAGFFSWPSSGKFTSYLADIEKADASVPDLSTFIQVIIQNTSIEKLHLIAHSMGNRILTFSLKNLTNSQILQDKIRIINQIILGAPDIDQDVFKQTILPELKNIGMGRTLYSSDKDEALIFSKKMRGGYARLGDCGNHLFVENGLDTVDASNVPARGNNHSYLFETKELLTDLYYLLGKGLKPNDRRLRARDRNGLNYWLFPK